MKSTDHNLNNPMVIDTINLYPSIDSTRLSPVIVLSMEEYNLIQIKDPTCIYVINNTNKKIVYYGEWLIEKDNLKRMYLLGPANKFGEYTLYVNETDGHNDRLIQICRYNDPQLAISELNKFNKAGSHYQINLQVYSVISDYIVKNISLNDMLIGIIALFGYQNDTRLQDLIQILTSCNINTDNKIQSQILLKEQVKVFKTSNNHLFKYYSDLYDLVISYNYFQGKEFQKDPGELDLSKVIEKVLKIMTNII